MVLVSHYSTDNNSIDILCVLDLLTRTRAPLVTSSAGADSSDRSMQASNLYSHAWQHIHWLKFNTKARGYCKTQHIVKSQRLFQ